MEISVNFTRTRETKNAFVFSEVDDSGNVLETADAIVGTVYIKKAKISADAMDIEMLIRPIKKAKKAKAEKPVKTAAVKKTVKKVAVKKAA